VGVSPVDRIHDLDLATSWVVSAAFADCH